MSQKGPLNKEVSEKLDAESPNVVDIKYCIHEIQLIKEELMTNHLFKIPSHMQASHMEKELSFPGGIYIDLTNLKHVIFFAQGANDECTVPKKYMDELMVPYRRYKDLSVALPLMIEAVESSLRTILPEARKEKIKILQNAFLRLMKNRGVLCHFLEQSPLKRKFHGREAADQHDSEDCFLNQNELIEDFIEYSKFCAMNNLTFEDSRKPFIRFFEYLLHAYQDKGMNVFDLMKATRASIFIEDCGGPKTIKEMIKNDSDEALYGPLSSNKLKALIKVAVEEIDKFTVFEKYRLLKLNDDQPKSRHEPHSDSAPSAEPISTLEFEVEEGSELPKFKIKRRKFK